MKPLRPCRHPGCSALTREGYCPKHKPARAPRRASAEYHSWYSLPIWTEDLRPAQLLREPFCRACAAQYPPGDPRHRTRATVVDHIEPHRGSWAGSSIRPTTRACASAITTRKRPGNRQRNGGKKSKIDPYPGREATSAPGSAGGRRGTRAGESLRLSTHPPHPKKVLRGGVQDRMPPRVRENVPDQETGAVGAG